MITKDDPRLTSFVLGELREPEATEVARAVKASVELQRAVKEIRRATLMLDSVFREEPVLELTQQQKAALGVAASRADHEIAQPVARQFRSSQWIALAVAASLVGLLLAFNYLPGLKSSPATGPVAAESRSAGSTEAPATSDDSLVVDGEPGAGDQDNAVDFGNATDSQQQPDAPAPAGTSVARSELDKPELDAHAGAVGGLENEVARSQPKSISQDLGQHSPLAARQADKLAPPPDDQPQKQPPLGETWAQVSPREMVTRQTKKLLDQSNLAMLGMEVRVRERPGTQAIPQPRMRLEPRRRISVVTDEDGNAKEVASTITVAVREQVIVQTPILFVEPYVVISEDDALALVQTLAAEVDADESKPLTLEQLIGLKGQLLLRGGELEKLAQATLDLDDLKPESGGFARPASLGDRASRAAVALGQTLKRQYSLPPGVEPTEPIQTNTAVDEVSPDRDLTRGAGGELSPDKEGIQSDAFSEDMVADSQADQETVRSYAVHAQVPKSLDDIDFSQLVLQLKAALEIRNQRVSARAKNPNK